MKTIKLKKLTLQDWRAQNRTIEFTDNTEITGRNESGKSSIFNAFLWVLMNCDSDDRVNYKLFDEKEKQTYENSKMASVEAVIEVDGVVYSLKKTAKSGWIRKKGREIYEKKSTDEYHFYIDQIERNATDYKAFIEETLAPFPKLKLMLNINYYLGMDWKYLRRIFEDLVGTIKEEDFKGDYSIIKDELTKYSPEQIKESIKSQIRPIKQDIGSLPITIETLKSSLPNIEYLDEVQQEIDDAKSQIEMIDKQLLGSSESLQKFIDKRNEELVKISALEANYRRSEDEYMHRWKETTVAIDAEIAKIAFINNEISRENDKAKQTIANAKESLKLANTKLKKQNDEVKAMQFTDDTCAFCGQKLPEEKLEEAKSKFNANKDAKHKSIVAEGRANNVKIEQCEKEIAELKAIIEEGYEEKPLKDKSELEAKLKKLEDEFVPYEQTTEGKEKMAVISDMKANLTIIPAQDNEALLNMKKSLMQDIETLSKKLGLKEEYDKQILTIQMKQKELKDSAVELARLEGMLNAVEKYEREKASIISFKVNNRFNYLKVEMTEVNKSGNIIDTCRILDKKNIPATVTNTASRILIGIDLSISLQKFYGLCLPLFIDEAHTIDSENFPKVETQIVKMWNNGKDFNVENK